MGSNITRRAVLASAGGLSAAAILSWASPVPVANAQQSIPEATPLRDGVFLFTGFGGNVLAARSGDAVMLVDSGSAEASDALLSALRATAAFDAPDLLFNTHWHVSHTGGNEYLRSPETRILSHIETRRWMSTEFNVRWEGRRYKPRAAEALPTDTFFSSDAQPLEVSLGTRIVEYAHLENAHTDGDIYVMLRDSNVLVAGGAVAANAYPVIDYSTGGWIDGLIAAAQTLISVCDAETLIVPGRGPVKRRDHLRAQYEMTAAVRERVAERMRVGKGVEEIVAEGITKDFDPLWGQGNNADVFVANIYADLAWRGPGGTL
jgi:glyoxylase-like metal-dependent hydrolase (beta-lactamase superfamily II)